jgi:hypothetical protein
MRQWKLLANPVIENLYLQAVLLGCIYHGCPRQLAATAPSPLAARTGPAALWRSAISSIR